MTVFDQDQSPREATGGTPRETFDVTNHGAGLGKIRQDISATSVEKMDASQKMTMGSVPHLDNSAGNAEVSITSKEQLLAKGNGSQGEERETKVEQELAEPFKYEVCQVQRGHP